jgi:hypothetical protein
MGIGRVVEWAGEAAGLLFPVQSPHAAAFDGIDNLQPIGHIHHEAAVANQHLGLALQWFPCPRPRIALQRDNQGTIHQH